MLFGILDTAGMDCRKAIASELADFEDAVMTETAFRCEMEGIVTRNVKDYKKSPVPVYQPEEFLTLFHAEEEIE